jgi:hypothetical protein
MKNQSTAPSSSAAVIAAPKSSTVRPRPALREPMVWLIAGLPLAAVVAAFWLLAVAIRSGGADEVQENVRVAAGMQVADTGPDARAQELKLSAVLSLSDGKVSVLPASGAFARNEPLVLTLSHPVDARADRRLLLQADGSGWHLAGNLRAGHDWIAELAPHDGSWRLRGRLRAGQLAAYLGPASAGN